MSRKVASYGSLAALLAVAALFCGPASAQMLFAFPVAPAQTETAPRYEAMPAAPEEAEGQLDPRLQRQTVNYSTNEAPGTVVIDTAHTYLYYVLGDGKAMRYGIGVGREGFTWAGVQKVARKAEWPDWYPPPEMVARQPYLPRMTAGGPGNPLGARAMYLGNSEYRIHGTNNPATIGKQVSSGCIRLTNDDVSDLYERVQVGAKVVVLPQSGAGRLAQSPAIPPQMRSQPISLTSSYAPDSGAQQGSYRPSRIY
jgi:lipoprotein-anchoring transpeptidase ErfK/SrfK